MQVGIGVAEGGQIQLGAAPQLLDGAGSAGQIVGKVHQLLGLALAQLLLVVLQGQNAAALVSLILEQVQHAGFHLADLEHNGLPALVVFITIKAAHW